MAAKTTEHAGPSGRASLARHLPERRCLPSPAASYAGNRRSAGQNGAEICLLRVLFGIPDDHDEETLCSIKINYLGESYAVKELAADLGMSIFSVYKMFSEERPIRFSTVLRILDFIRFKNPNDMRLIDFITRHAGCTAMPNDILENERAIRDLLTHAGRIINRRNV